MTRYETYVKENYSLSVERVNHDPILNMKLKLVLKRQGTRKKIKAPDGMQYQ